jgi:hypothetical protein
VRGISAQCYVASMQSDRDDSRFVSVLSEIMDRTGLKPQTLANATGTNPSVISRWLSGETKRPKPESVGAFAAGLVSYWPDAVDLVAPLFEALGYMPVMPALPPQIVRDNWEKQDVRRIWSLENIPDEAKVTLVSAYLESLEACGNGEAGNG